MGKLDLIFNILHYVYLYIKLFFVLITFFSIANIIQIWCSTLKYIITNLTRQFLIIKNRFLSLK